jgi:hypothetical protein
MTPAHRRVKVEFDGGLSLRTSCTFCYTFVIKRGVCFELNQTRVDCGMFH